MNQREKNRGKAHRHGMKHRPSVTIGDPTVRVSGRWLLKALAVAMVGAAVCVYIALRLMEHFGHRR